ncbi:carbonic anhydrase [Nocardia sp. CNY236]|uniref:carbonic anhydrase n=1 Tax=Nocardia sp. CNY236 TaxID=1169152 RepID=UPI0004908B68|nr:carbonic anhydrase [Nocardia sp. CNY236]
MPDLDPINAWKSLRDGNERFVAGAMLHPGQGAADRAALVGGQHPHAIVLGCSDSRAAAELIFDQGLGDIFVVRTAGHVVDNSVVGSIEYGVQVLRAPLVVVLGHESCGAVKATIAALDGGGVPGGFIRSVVERVTPSILTGRQDGLSTVDELTARHVEETSRLLMDRSTALAQRIEAGECAIVCATYGLGDGRVQVHRTIGDIGAAA